MHSCGIPTCNREPSRPALQILQHKAKDYPSQYGHRTQESHNLTRVGLKCKYLGCFYNKYHAMLKQVTVTVTAEEGLHL